jgi:hypothetical protein
VKHRAFRRTLLRWLTTSSVTEKDSSNTNLTVPVAGIQNGTTTVAQAPTNSGDTLSQKIGNLSKSSMAVNVRITAREAWCLDHIISVALENPDQFGSETVERQIFFLQLRRIQKQLPVRGE